MIPIKQMQADRLYLIEGTSVANSPFFESEADCKLFLSLADKYLAGYMLINCFQNSRDGWVMIVTTKSAKAIRTAYENRRKQSKKCKEDCAHHEIWRMLSDQIRIMLSTYVKATNENTGRTGGKVKVRQAVSLYSIISKYFGMNRGAKKENSRSSATDKQRRVITKDDEIIIHEFSAWRTKQIQTLCL